MLQVQVQYYIFPNLPSKVLVDLMVVKDHKSSNDKDWQLANVEL
jgi:hypothetical protein